MLQRTAMYDTIAVRLSLRGLRRHHAQRQDPNHNERHVIGPVVNEKVHCIVVAGILNDEAYRSRSIRVCDVQNRNQSLYATK